jgi:hypothetical protein
MQCFRSESYIFSCSALKLQYAYAILNGYENLSFTLRKNIPVD